MATEAQKVLLKYWGYAAFRPMQEEIVNSVLAGNDTLALLPTGGGKSVCFQVPGLMQEGLCLVITPLIALMKDQVQHLKKINIPAAAIYSGLHPNEVELAYNLAVFGRLKFLYVSPERIQTERFLDLIRRMKINLIAVDESHCISQWGYDFRPPYLQIAQIRPFLPNTPVLALTATATKMVVTDIQQRLSFKKNNVFQTSYERKNLTYNVLYEPDKYGVLLRLLQKSVSGSAIVYVRNRKRTHDISDYLQSKGISSTFYHAGLDARLRDERQKLWMQGRSKVIVSTNAFGMGIDKPDVRMVIHFDLPDSLEAYFQEAGRAGRDGKESGAYLLISDQDIGQLKLNYEASFPDLNQIRSIYQAIGNYFQIPVGTGRDIGFDFDLVQFSKNYGFQTLEVFHALKLLEKDGMLLLSEGITAPSRVFVTAKREDLYRIQVEQPSLDPFIKLILRNYPGIMTDFVVISESDLSRKLEIPVTKVEEIITALQKLNVLSYSPHKEKPQLIFTTERRNKEDLLLTNETYRDRKMATLKRVQSVIDFVTNNELCRNIQLLGYFGESIRVRCGKFDVCIKRNSLLLTEIEFETIKNSIRDLLLARPYPVFELVSEIDFYTDEKILEAIRWLIDNKVIQKDENDNLIWRKQLEI
jgi:ATP-dependent DNA helicase RecQ